MLKVEFLGAEIGLFDQAFAEGIEAQELCLHLTEPEAQCIQFAGGEQVLAEQLVVGPLCKGGQESGGMITRLCRSSMDLTVPEAGCTGAGSHQDQDQDTEPKLHPGSNAVMASVRKAVFHPVIPLQKTRTWYWTPGHDPSKNDPSGAIPRPNEQFLIKIQSP